VQAEQGWGRILRRAFSRSSPAFRSEVGVASSVPDQARSAFKPRLCPADAARGCPAPWRGRAGRRPGGPCFRSRAATASSTGERCRCDGSLGVDGAQSTFIQLIKLRGATCHLTHMPNSGRCIPVYPCTCPHDANGGNNRNSVLTFISWTRRTPTRRRFIIATVGW
jgi:hypothetical protein